MPRGKDHARSKEEIDLDLTPQQRAAITQAALRRPSQKIGENVKCGARLSPEALKRRAAKGSKNTDPLCQEPAGNGTSHPGVGYCKWHGGNTESGRKAAARTAGAAYVEKFKADVLLFGGDKDLVNITPEQAILEEVRRSVAMVRFLEQAIAKWQFDANPQAGDGLGGLPTLVDETFKGNSTFTDEREWLLLYRAEREHAVKVARMAIDAGIAQRLVTIAEDQGRTLAIAIRMVLDALNLTPDQIAAVPRIVPPILRQVTQGTPMPVPQIAD